MVLRISDIINDSIVDGQGLRLVIFVQGCPHKCDGCHNPHTHDFNGGKIVTLDNIISKIKKNPLLSGIMFSGGEPFCQAASLAKLGNYISSLGMNIVTYTGYTFEYLYDNKEKNDYQKLLNATDILIDGKFIKELKSLELKFRGSSNQRYLDCKTSMKYGKAIDYAV